MKKHASVVAKSIDDLANILSKSNVKGNAKALANKAMFGDNGTGSLLLDFFKPHKKIKPLNKSLNNIQKYMADIDMRAGGKVYDFLDNSKSKSLNNLKNALVQEQEFITQNLKNQPSKHIKIKTTGITNPITKAKNSVVPVLGTMALANVILPSKNEDGEQNDY